MLTSLHPKVTPGVFCFFLKSNHSCWDYPWNAILNCKVEFRGSSFVLHFKNHKVCFFFIVKIIYSCNQNVAINININIKMLTFCYMVCPSCHLKEYENWLIKYSSSTFMREGLYRAPGIQGSSTPPHPRRPRVRSTRTVMTSCRQHVLWSPVWSWRRWSKKSFPSEVRPKPGPEELVGVAWPLGRTVLDKENSTRATQKDVDRTSSEVWF